MANVLKSWWLWLGAGLGAAAVVVALLQGSDAPPKPPAATIEATLPEDTAAPEPPTVVEEVVDAEDVSEITQENEVITGESEAIALAAPPQVADDAMPAESPAAPLLPGPELTEELSAASPPELPEESVRIPAGEVAPLLGASSPPLSLAQILPPGQAPKPDQIAPSFDLVRVAPDGSAVIAGRAEPGANVQVFSGTVPIAEVIASPRGEFVVLLDNPSGPASDIEPLTSPEGAELVVSQADIVILPAQPDAPGSTSIVLRRTPDAVQIVQPSGPAIPSNVSLDLVSYTDSGAVRLAGRGQPGNTVRIYANGALAGEARIVAGGNWVLEIADIEEGRYMLRVDEIGPEGQVESRTESPFQRVFPSAELPGSFLQGAKIIVQPGNTLWLMASEAYGDGDAYTQIFSANIDAIRDPDLIYPGQIFEIPRLEE